jgi:flagellar protein FliO/FliZ
MNKSILLSRAVATATAAFGACLLASASPAVAFTPSLKSGGESTRLNLTPSTSSAAHATSSGGASIVRTIVGLAIVIAVIWGLAWILKQVKAGKDGGRDSNQSSAGLASIAALTLGSGRTVHLVRAGSDFVLLGATEHGLSPIHRYTEEEAREAGIFADEEPVERSRLANVASQLVANAGRVVSHSSYASRSGFHEPPALPRQTGLYHDEQVWLTDSPRNSRELSPARPPRPNPMQAQPQSGNLIERLREMTVRK